MGKVTTQTYGINMLTGTSGAANQPCTRFLERLKHGYQFYNDPEGDCRTSKMR
jgi:hypothetical protein